jgi:hypothetical protein
VGSRVGKARWGVCKPCRNDAHHHLRGSIDLRVFVPSPPLKYDSV